jgi:hypothetical protein
MGLSFAILKLPRRLGSGLAASTGALRRVLFKIDLCESFLYCQGVPCGSKDLGPGTVFEIPRVNRVLVLASHWL